MFLPWQAGWNSKDRGCSWHAILCSRLKPCHRLTVAVQPSPLWVCITPLPLLSFSCLYSLVNSTDIYWLHSAVRDVQQRSSEHFPRIPLLLRLCRFPCKGCSCSVCLSSESWLSISISLPRNCFCQRWAGIDLDGQAVSSLVSQYQSWNIWKITSELIWLLPTLSPQQRCRIFCELYL